MAEWTGLVSFLTAILLSFVDLRFSVVPLAGFVLLCLVAPFLPFLGYYLPIISRGKSGEQAVALTFDDGPDPLSTPESAPVAFKASGSRQLFLSPGKKRPSTLNW